MTTAPTIVVVDDTAGTRFALRRTLENAGYAVVEGATGAEALRLATSAKPALMVLDVHLPDLLGTDVVKRLKADPATRSIPVLQLSASYTDESDRALGLESGADAYLTEPVATELLLATIHALLRSREAERVAERALETRDRFLSIASHDMRGLLHALRLTLESQFARAQSRTFDPEGLSRMIRRSVDDVRRMTRLVEDLLDRSQMQAGKLSLQTGPADLSSVVAKTVQSLAAEAKDAGSTIELDAPEPVPGHFDAGRVGQIVANLLSNAVKYGAGKPIRVSVRRIGDAAEIAVSDRGPGIEESEQKRIFERFERGEAPRSGSYGLGLWIVRELLRLHGGSIALQSSAESGTTFTVKLPLAPSAA